MGSDKNSFAFIHGEIVPLNEAFLHVSDLSVQRGFGVFDFFRIQNGHPFFLNRYFDRFYASAQMLGLEVPGSKSDLKKIIYELIHKNDIPVSGMKMILTGGYSPDGFTPALPNLIITQQEISLPGPELLQGGVKIMTHEYVRELALAKTINYVTGILLLKELKFRGLYDVLYHQKGVVTEFPRSNFFIVTPDNRVVTPGGNVLAGVTRENILNVAGKRYQAEAGTVTLTDVAEAKEAFITSTTKRLIPIVQVDGHVIGTGKPGEITKMLLQDLIQLETEDLKQAK